MDRNLHNLKLMLFFTRGCFRRSFRDAADSIKMIRETIQLAG